MTSTFLLDPAVSQTVTIGFAASATAVGPVTVQPRGLVPGGPMLVATPTLAAGQVQLALTGGSDGERYDVAVRASLAGGTTGERMLDVAVISPGWTMPDGNPGWLSITGFVERFGLEETILATDRDGTGAIDRSWLVGALRDAQAECEAHVAGRYALPLASVPGLLQTAVADLARARLYPRGAPEGVSTSAGVQRRILERIGAGAIALPGISGGGDDSPVIGWTGDMGFRDRMEAFQ